jgi:hypothetical protein
VREISAELVHGFVGQPRGLHWQSTALQAIQEAAEAYLVYLFEDTYSLTLGILMVGICVRFMRGVLRLCSVICTLHNVCVMEQLEGRITWGGLYRRENQWTPLHDCCLAKLNCDGPGQVQSNSN